MEKEKDALRQAQVETETKLARYIELYDYAPVGQVTLDDKINIVEVNLVGAALLGRDRSTLIGQSFSEAVTPSTRPTLEAFLSTLHGADRASCDVTLAPRGNFSVEVHLEGVRERVGQVQDWRCRAVLLELAEISHHRRKDPEDGRAAFLGMLSHRLRDPLSPIRNSLYLLERAEPGSDQASRARETIQRQAAHLTNLVQDLMDVARLSRDKLVLQKAQFDLRAIVERETDGVRALFDESGVELRVDNGPKAIWVNADGARIAQVLNSLLQNAAKFTPTGGTVFVGLTASEGRAKLSVRDTGVGMKAEQVERMFELFERGDHALAEAKVGVGLGLALVRGLVELHGGTVSARSEGPGRGSEFIVTLRLSGPGLGTAEQPRNPETRGARSILIIEDNVDAGRSLAEVLELNGYGVTVVRDGRSGIATAREFRPDAVICDIGLPDLDGYEVARTLRAESAFSATRLIALSGFAQHEDRQRARAAGFHAHLSKPASPEALLAAVAADGGGTPQRIESDGVGDTSAGPTG